MYIKRFIYYFKYVLKYLILNRTFEKFELDLSIVIAYKNI